MVQEIETKAHEDGALVLQKDPIPLKSYSVRGASEAISSDPQIKRKEWIVTIAAIIVDIDKTTYQQSHLWPIYEYISTIRRWWNYK